MPQRPGCHRGLEASEAWWLQRPKDLVSLEALDVSETWRLQRPGSQGGLVATEAWWLQRPVGFGGLVAT